MKTCGRNLLVLVVLLGIWQCCTYFGQWPPYLLPSPMLVAQSLWQHKLLLAQETWPTILEAVAGLVLAVLWGMIAALVMCVCRPIKALLLPVLVLSQALPTLAIAPIIVIWLGYGMGSKIMLGVLALFFPVTAAFYDGLRQLAAEHIDLASVMQASKGRRLLWLQIPAALPALASGIRVAAAWAPMAAVIGEWVGASQGLGFLMLDANARLATPLMFAALTVLVGFSLLLYFAVDRLLRIMIPWQLQGDSHA